MRQDQLFMTIVQTQCCQFFFNFLIKKEWMLLQRVVCVLCHAGGAFLFTIEKVKTKKGLCTIQKVKTKTLQMKVFQFQA